MRIGHTGDLVFERVVEGLYVLVANRKEKVKGMIVDNLDLELLKKTGHNVEILN